MSLPAALVAALSVLAACGYAVYRYLMGILVGNLLAAPEMHLDFSATLEPSAPPAGAGAGAGAAAAGPVVLFFHEYAAPGASYRKYCGFLETDGARILAPDFPPTDPRGPRVFPSSREVEAGVAFVARAREAAGSGPWIGFGVSRGAATLLLALAQAPAGSRPAGLVLDSFGAAPDLVELLIRRFAPIYLGPLARGLPGWFVRFTARRGLAAAGATLGTHYPDPTPQLGALGVPILFIHGGRDRAIPPTLLPGYRARSAPGSEALVVEGARHNGAVITDPRTYAARVRDFVARCGAGPVRR